MPTHSSTPARHAPHSRRRSAQHGSLAMSEAPYVVYSTPDGAVGERRGLRAVDYWGMLRQPDDLIPLPAGVTLSMLPQRLAVGLDAQGQRVTIDQRYGWALATLLPIGYTRTLLPGYEMTPESEPLPFFGYTAVAGSTPLLFAPTRPTAGCRARLTPANWSALCVSGLPQNQKIACCASTRTVRSIITVP